MHRLRESDIPYVGNGAADAEQAAGHPLQPDSGAQEEGEKRRDVEMGRLEKWLKKLIHALFPDIGFRKEGCLLKRCEGTNTNFQT